MTTDRTMSLMLAVLLLAIVSSPSIADEAVPEAAAETPAAETETAAQGTTETEAVESKDEKPPEPPPYILRPYRVRVGIFVRPAARISASGHAELLSETTTALNARFRQGWELDLGDVETEERRFARSLADFGESAWTEAFRTLDVDKVILGVVTKVGARFEIEAREWDADSQTAGVTQRRHAWEAREVPLVLADAVGAAFRASARLDVLEGDEYEFLIRGGELPPAERSLTPFPVGSYLIPYLRYLDRSRKLRSIQRIPWTYLQVDEQGRHRIRAHAVSAFRAPIPGARRRVEVGAIAVRPDLSETELTIMSRGEARLPLAAARVDLVPRLPTRDDPVEERVELVTDRNGLIRVPANPENPLQFALIHSGQALLARVPLIPGMASQLELEVPNDAARLLVEGEVSLFQGELIDIVARREVLMARARNAARQNRWDDVDQFLLELQELPTLREFEQRVETLQVRAVFEAQQAKDRVAESRIKRLCQSIRDAAARNLDPIRIQEFRREMNELRPRG